MARLPTRESQKKKNLQHYFLILGRNMKKHLYLYAVLIILYIAYNQFFRTEDDKIHTLVNVLFASLLFGYIALMSFVLLKKMKK